MNYSNMSFGCSWYDRCGFSRMQGTSYGSSTKIIVDLLVFSLLIGGKTVLHVHVLRIVDTGYVLMH